MTAIPHIADAPPPYDAVLFDCDSTLSAIEGIDELARALGPEAAAELASLTERAMAGELPLEAVYAQRLERVRPGREVLTALGARYAANLEPGARELIGRLEASGAHVALVSGGLRPALVALAAAVGLGPERLHAVDVRFDSQGRFADFERTSPLTRSGGKLEFVKRLRRTLDLGRVALVGDGATDLEAAPALARFVAYGGVVERPAVFAAARPANRVRSFAALAPLLLPPALLQPEDPAP